MFQVGNMWAMLNHITFEEESFYNSELSQLSATSFEVHIKIFGARLYSHSKI